MGHKSVPVPGPVTDASYTCVSRRLPVAMLTPVLQDPLLEHVLAHCGPAELVHCARVCREWASFCKARNVTLWAPAVRQLHRRNRRVHTPAITDYILLVAHDGNAGCNFPCFQQSFDLRDNDNREIRLDMSSVLQPLHGYVADDDETLDEVGRYVISDKAFDTYMGLLDDLELYLVRKSDGHSCNLGEDLISHQDKFARDGLYGPEQKEGYGTMLRVLPLGVGALPARVLRRLIHDPEEEATNDDIIVHPNQFSVNAVLEMGVESPVWSLRFDLRQIHAEFDDTESSTEYNTDNFSYRITLDDAAAALPLLHWQR